MIIQTSPFKRCPKMTLFALLFGTMFFARSGAIAKLGWPILDRVIGLGFKLLGDEVPFLDI
jgi:hypothetical protein